ncbi:MAG: RNA 2'-phosphotransferase [Alphaproteobacteria bacterium]
MTTDIELSRTLSYWLRHKPEAAALTLSPEGWADVDLVLAAFERERLSVGWERLLHIVDTSDKSRFELSADCARIRARQGHSVPVDAGWMPATPPQLLYHGTIQRFWASIQSEGLKAMKRHHVHLSADMDAAQCVGQRRGAPIILIVDAGGLAETDEQFFLTSNGVWLVKHVPPQFLSKRP